MSDDDLLCFAPEDENPEPDGPEEVEFDPVVHLKSGDIAPLGKTWKILVVDDDASVHDITRLTIGDLTFDKREVKLLHAHSGAEAKEIFGENPDIAVALVDVVMETDDAGLELVRWVRSESNSTLTRLILRTGQPGEAPARDVIRKYEINDYRAKTDLTSEALYTSIMAALRSYRDLTAVHLYRQGLERIVSASAAIFELQSIESFFERVLNQLMSIFLMEEDAALCQVGADGRVHVLMGRGGYAGQGKAELGEVVEPSAVTLVTECLRSGQSSFGNPWMCVVLPTGTDTYGLLLCAKRPLDKLSMQLVELLVHNITVAVDNLGLHDDLKEMNHSMQKFVPAASLGLLGRQDIVGISLGEYAVRHLNVLMIDIRGFTGLCESMEPSDAFRLVNSFMGAVAPIVDAHHGAIDKYLGDGLLAVFGREDTSSTDAVLCAVEMFQTVRAYNEEKRRPPIPRSREGGPRADLKIGIGLDAGQVIVGTVGFQQRLDFTVLGDKVNTASRIEELTKEVGASILIHGDVERDLRADIQRRFLGNVPIRGRETTVPLWEIFAADLPESRVAKEKHLDPFRKAVAHFDSGSTLDARKAFLDLQHAMPDDLVVEWFLARLRATTA